MLHSTGQGGPRWLALFFLRARCDLVRYLARPGPGDGGNSMLEIAIPHFKMACQSLNPSTLKGTSHYG